MIPKEKRERERESGDGGREGVSVPERERERESKPSHGCAVLVSKDITAIEETQVQSFARSLCISINPFSSASPLSLSPPRSLTRLLAERDGGPPGQRAQAPPALSRSTPHPAVVRLPLLPAFLPSPFLPV